MTYWSAAAVLVMAKRTARQRNQLPDCYYEGYLEKRSFKDKTSRRLWTCLCGNTLFFFNEKRETDYIEKLDLSGFISITDDCSQDRNLDAARLNLQMKDGNIKFTVPNAEARELWKGYIHSVAELAVPSSLNLLPGQIHMLKVAIETEKERIKTVLPNQINMLKEAEEKESTKTVPPPAVTNSSPYISLQAHMPACYHSVSRLEAELLLEREAERGNLLLRPGRGGNSFAVTTRQDLDGSVFKHYRVTRKHDGGFIIDVDNPVPCATLHDLINYLVEKTDGVLIPLIMEEPYEKNISFIRSDNENGERSVQQAPSNLIPPAVPPKPAALRIPTPEPAAVSVGEEHIYLNDKPEKTENKTDDSPAVPLPQLEKTKKAIMPPSPAPRKWFSSTSTPSSTSSTNSRDPKIKAPADSQGQIPLAALSELKIKLEQKARPQK